MKDRRVHHIIFFSLLLDQVELNSEDAFQLFTLTNYNLHDQEEWIYEDETRITGKIKGKRKHNKDVFINSVLQIVKSYEKKLRFIS